MNGNVLDFESEINNVDYIRQNRFTFLDIWSEIYFYITKDIWTILLFF